MSTTRITADWHIHSRHSCECHERGMDLDEMAAGAERMGIVDFGVTDHLHSSYNLPDIAASRREFLSRPRGARFHFGVEVTCMRQWELDEINAGRYTQPPIYGIGGVGPESVPAIPLDAEIMAQYGIEYVVGGVHWAKGIAPEPAKIIEYFHRQHMFLATCPLVDIVAHPWWWHNHFKYPDGTFVPAPWTSDFSAIPRSCHDEFAAAMVQHGTAVEINHPWMLDRRYGTKHFDQYLEYMLFLKERGVKFSLGSDWHDRPFSGVDFAAAAALLDILHMTDKDLWYLPPRKEQ